MEAELESQPQVYRSKDPEDGRAQRIALTPLAEVGAGSLAQAISHQLNLTQEARLNVQAEGERLAEVYFSYIIHKACLIIIYLTLCLSVFVDQLERPNEAVIPCVRLAR